MNLLIDDLLRVVTPNGVTRMTLPRLLSALARDEVVSYPGIRPHQEEPWHVFLCYLAAAALARVPGTPRQEDAAYWRDALRELAGRSDDLAWVLVVGDAGMPGFLQPPVTPEADRRRLGVLGATPDEIDVLETARNHDVKLARADSGHVDNWIFALTTLQTSAGYGGPTRYGISRMNRGYGTRMFVELVHSHSAGARWRDAVQRLGLARNGVLEGPWGYSPMGHVLLWLLPWDGAEALSLMDLDPFFIEVCRRIRLEGQGHIVAARYVGTKTQRIDASTLNGVVGDPWTPEKSAENAALTPSAAGLSADFVRKIIFEDGVRTGALMRPLPNRHGGCAVKVSALIRGQSKTEGYRSVTIPIPDQMRPRLFGPGKAPEPVARLALNGIEGAGKMELRVLKPAFFVAAEGAPDKLRFDRDSAAAWWVDVRRRFEQLWEPEYFPWLWRAALGNDTNKSLDDWHRMTARHAEAVLNATIDNLPGHTGRSYKIRVEAQRRFRGALLTNFPNLKEESNETATSA